MTKKLSMPELRQVTRKVKPINDFVPRRYQIPFLSALNGPYKKLVAILPRRAGKDILVLNYVIRQMWESPGNYYYTFPSFAEGRRSIWEAISNDGKRLLDYFPKKLVVSQNANEMKLVMKTRCGRKSFFNIIGSNRYDRLRGSNPRCVVFSEYAQQDPQAYATVSPVLLANQGKAIFISTPWGRENHLYELWKQAQDNEHWFHLRLDVSQTNHVSEDDIEQEIKDGTISRDMVRQEYYTEFLSTAGGYYGTYLNDMYKEGRITDVPWNPTYKVHTAWDLGYSDNCAILFFQKIKNHINIIDSYTNNKRGLEHYINIVNRKKYTYGTHIAPWDLKMIEYGSGTTRYTKALSLGFKFMVLEKSGLMDGIECARSTLPRCYIDVESCGEFIKALEGYRQNFNSKTGVYEEKPAKGRCNHFADSYRYLSLGAERIKDKTTPEELDARFKRAQQKLGMSVPFLASSPFRGWS